MFRAFGRRCDVDGSLRPLRFWRAQQAWVLSPLRVAARWCRLRHSAAYLSGLQGYLSMPFHIRGKTARRARARPRHTKDNDVRFPVGTFSISDLRFLTGFRQSRRNNNRKSKIQNQKCFSDAVHRIEKILALSIDAHAELLSFSAKALFQFTD